MKRIDLKQLTPPGRGISQIMQGAGFALFAAVVRSFGFFSEYLDARNLLYIPRRVGENRGERMLMPGAVMAPFSQILRGSFSLFPLFWLFMGLEVVAAYLYHRKDSKSIYLMRRLPDKWELHRRCWGVPVICSLGSLVLMGGLTMVYGLVYLVFTPAECLPY